MSILSRVQANPEIGTLNTTYVTDLVERAKRFWVSYTRLPRFPELIQGYSKSAASAGTNLTALDSNTLYISVNGSAAIEIAITLASCTTGLLTAAELQSCIQAEVDTTGFDEVTVTYAGTQYTITSGRYGEDSAINVTFDEDYKHVCQSMKLSPAYGGTELCGAAYDETAEDDAVAIVEAMYRKLGLEAIQIGGIPGDVYFNLPALGLEPWTIRNMNARRRLW